MKKHFSNKLKVANMAFTELKIDPVDSLEELFEQTLSVDKRQISLFNTLDNVIDSRLEKHYWQFATVSAPITMDVDGGCFYPPDCLRLVGLGLTGCVCPCAIDSSISEGTTKINLLDDVNTFLKYKNSDRYLSTVAFTVVNSRWFYHLNPHGECCVKCEEIDTVFYTSANFDELKPSASFMYACAVELIARLTPTAKNEERKNEQKRASFLLYKEIEREYAEFKYRFKYNQVQAQRQAKVSSYNGFKLSSIG